MTPPDDAALQRRLQELFLEELDDQLHVLVDGLESLAGAPSADAAHVVSEMFRCAHSLKGAAFAAGATGVGSVCHDLEDLLVKLRDGDGDLDPATVVRLTALVDAVAERAAALRTESAPRSDEDRSGAGAPDDATEATTPVPVSSSHPDLATGSVTTAERTAPGGTAGTAGTAGRTSDAPSAGPGARISGHKVDTLMDQAGDLIAATYASEGLVGVLRRVERRLLDDELELQRSRDRILAELPDRESQARVAAVLAEVDARTRATAQDLREVLAQVAAHQQSLRVRASGFAESARRARMVPFENATSGLQRMVRELAVDLGKQVDLRIAATDVEVDKDLVHVLRDVLGHLVRNAVDHGVETPPERGRSGKPPRGTVHVAASLHSDGVRVVVRDDGRGLDETRLRRAASARGSAVRDRSAADLAFQPGLSTASRVSAVSGRGVGLDAVRSAVEKRGGTVSVRTEAGQGSSWTVLVPLNLSSMRTLLVRTGGQLVALPSTWVRRLVRLPADPDRVNGRNVVHVGGEALPLAALSSILGWEAATTGERTRTGVVLGGENGVAVLSVDQAFAEREVVLRGSPERLEEVHRVLGTAQLEDGSVVLVLNPAQCLRLALVAAGDEMAPQAAGAPRGDRRVLLAEDSLTTRELERSLLESAGFSVVVAHDGQQAWDLLQTTGVDAVVSDVNMPRMDGIELCRAIRGSTRLANLPVVLVTSLHTDADRRAGLDAGADAYLTKVGFNRDDLVAALERVL